MSVRTRIDTLFVLISNILRVWPYFADTCRGHRLPKRNACKLKYTKITQTNQQGHDKVGAEQGQAHDYGH